MKYVRLIKVMNWIEMHIFHWTPPAVITDSGQNFANVIQSDLNAIRLEPAQKIQNDPHINAFSMYSMYVKRSTLQCCEY